MSALELLEIRKKQLLVLTGERDVRNVFLIESTIEDIELLKKIIKK
jgi:hypothetical protein